MSRHNTVFLIAETTPERYAELTGLARDAGFVVLGGKPCGLYPRVMADRLGDALGAAGINHHPITADTYNEGRRKAAKILTEAVEA